MIPLAVGLVDTDGRDMALELEQGPCFGKRNFTSSHTAVLALTEAEQAFVFRNVADHPVPSLLRGFSAPVQVKYQYTDAELTHLMAYDADAFSRWEASQALITRVLLAGIEEIRKARAMTVPQDVADEQNGRAKVHSGIRRP